MIERINKVLREKNLSNSQFADEIGIQRSGMSHLVSGRNKPSLDFILKILKRFPDIDPGWLLFGINKTEQGKINSGTVNQQNRKTWKESRNIEKVKTHSDKNQIDRTEDPVEKIVILYRDNSFKEYHPK